MLNRPEPLVRQASEVLRQINEEALGAGEGIRRIRRLFEHEESARTRCQLPELVREVQPILDMLARRIHGRLQFDVAPALPDVNIDRLRIQHVLFALVQNACDASVNAPVPAPIVITIASDRYMVETSIKDSGPGVEAGMREQLFKPFFTTKRNGTGLGLASSRAIIEAHEGTIGFDGCEGDGSRFWFRLPIAGH